MTKEGLVAVRGAERRKPGNGPGERYTGARDRGSVEWSARRADGSVAAESG